MKRLIIACIILSQLHFNIFCMHGAKLLHEIKNYKFQEAKDIIENENRPLVNNLNDLPFPARDYTAQVLKMGSAPAIYTGKGCHGKCTFCSIKAFYENCSGPKIRTRSSKSIVDEMEMLLKNFSLPQAYYVIYPLC